MNINFKVYCLLVTLIGYIINVVNCQNQISIKLNQSKPLDKKAILENLASFKLNVLPQRVQQFLNNNQKPKIQKLDLNSKQEVIAQTIDKSYQYLKEVIPLKNYLDVQYTGTIGVGSNKKEFTVLFDSGSNQLWVPQDTCSSCGFSQNRYSCSQNTCQATTDEIRYGKGYVKGNTSSDLVKIGRQQTTFPFLSIFESEDLEGFQSDGILGLGVNKKDSIVNKLYMEKKIEKNLYSFKLSKYQWDQNGRYTSDDSQLIFGGFDEKIVQNEKDVLYYKVISSNYWAIQMASARLGKTQLFQKKKDVRIALIDSGTSFINIPSQDFKALNQTVIENNKNCFNFSDLIVCFCTEKDISKLPSLTVSLMDTNNKEQNIHILPKNYILQDGGVCIYMFQKFPDIGLDNMWILGDVFMRQTYNIFNYEKRAVGIVDLEKTIDDEESSGSLFGGFAKFIILIVVIVIGVFLAKFVYDNYINKNQNQQQQQQYQQYQQQQVPMNPLNEQLV